MFSGVLLLVTVLFGGVEARCLVDTGSEATLVSERLAAQLPVALRVQHVAQVPLLGGGAVPTDLLVMPEVRTGELIWTNVNVYTLPDGFLPGSECLLGADLLRRQPVALLWDEQRIMRYER